MWAKAWAPAWLRGGEFKEDWRVNSIFTSLEGEDAHGGTKVGALTGGVAVPSVAGIIAVMETRKLSVRDKVVLNAARTLWEATDETATRTILPRRRGERRNKKKQGSAVDDDSNNDAKRLRRRVVLGGFNTLVANRYRYTLMVLAQSRARLDVLPPPLSPLLSLYIYQTLPLRHVSLFLVFLASPIEKWSTYQRPLVFLWTLNPAARVRTSVGLFLFVFFASLSAAPAPCAAHLSWGDGLAFRCGKRLAKKVVSD